MLEEELMETRIVGHLGVEAQTDVGSLHDRDRVIVEAGDNLNLGTGMLDERSPDEDRVERSDAQGLDRHVGLEGLDLPPVAVAPDPDIEGPEGDLVSPAVEDLAAQEDQPGAGGQGWHPACQALPERHLEVEDTEQPAHGRRFTAGEHERVDIVQLGGGAYRHRLGAALAEGRKVFPDVALEGENAYPQDGRFPLSGRDCSVPGGAGFASFARD